MWVESEGGEQRKVQLWPKEKRSVNSVEVGQDEDYVQRQVEMRRKFNGSIDQLKKNLDAAVGDAHGLQSNLKVQRTKDPQVQRWVWRHKFTRGAISFTYPSGELLMQGAPEHQVQLARLLIGWTTDWDGAIPAKKVETRAMGKKEVLGLQLQWVEPEVDQKEVLVCNISERKQRREHAEEEIQEGPYGASKRRRWRRQQVEKARQDEGEWRW